MTCLKDVLDWIYGGGVDNKDLAAVVRQIRRTLEDGFYSDPPSIEQAKVLKDLLVIADKIEGFYK